MQGNYAIGANLVNFLVERELISLSSEVSFTELPAAKKKGAGYYIPLSCYAMCNFYFSLLPIKLNLPMVCKPLLWNFYCKFAFNVIGYVWGLLKQTHRRYL